MILNCVNCGAPIESDKKEKMWISMQKKDLRCIGKTIKNVIVIFLNKKEYARGGKMRCTHAPNWLKEMLQIATAAWQNYTG